MCVKKFLCVGVGDVKYVVKMMEDVFKYDFMKFFVDVFVFKDDVDEVNGNLSNDWVSLFVVF